MVNKLNVRFEIGDVVKLNSGGPEMSICYVSDSGGDCTCQWFAGKKLEDGCFDKNSLILVRKQGAEIDT